MFGLWWLNLRWGASKAGAQWLFGVEHYRFKFYMKLFISHLLESFLLLGFSTILNIY
jgi:hypothetical protein